MKDWIVQRYNQGQPVYKLEYRETDQSFRILRKETGKWWCLSLHELLFDHRWGFSEGFARKKEMISTARPITVGREGTDHVNPGLELIQIPSWQHHLMQMAGDPDPLAYLETFNTDDEAKT